jgi:DNA repair photolyase
MTPEAWRQAAPRKDILAQLHKQLGKGPPPKGSEVHLCFTTDPYQPCEAEHHITRRAIQELAGAGLRPAILTKNPRLALQDLGLLLETRAKFGVTMLLTEEKDREHWEPGASTLADRAGALGDAKSAGLETWLSIEPVIDPAQALDVISRVGPYADTVKVGKLNHDAEIEKGIDWRKFLFDALERLADIGARYYIKTDLAAFGGEGFKQTGGE